MGGCLVLVHVLTWIRLHALGGTAGPPLAAQAVVHWHGLGIHRLHAGLMRKGVVSHDAVSHPELRSGEAISVSRRGRVARSDTNMQDTAPAARTHTAAALQLGTVTAEPNK